MNGKASRANLLLEPLISTTGLESLVKGYLLLIGIRVIAYPSLIYPHTLLIYHWYKLVHLLVVGTLV